MRLAFKLQATRHRDRIQRRWCYLWRNSRITMEHHQMPSYLRYVGRRWRVWIHWGAVYDPAKPTICHEWILGSRPRRLVYPANRRA